MDDNAAMGFGGLRRTIEQQKVDIRLNKFERQDRQYAFPYHHLPHFVDGIGVRSRALGWGLEYLCYSLELKNRVEDLNPRSVLDVGCGDGRFLGLLTDVVERKLGIDLSERAINLARAFRPDLDYRVCDVRDVEERFDVVTLIEVLEHVPDEIMTKFLNSVVERLRPGGSLLVSVPSKVMPFVKKHFRHYDEELLRETLDRAGLPVDAVKIDFLVPQKPKFWIWLIEKLAYNRAWTFECRPVQTFLWRSMWRDRFTTHDNGRHLLCQLVKE